MPTVHLITTGGTIASRVDPLTGAATPAIDANELVASVPQLSAIADIEVTAFSQLASWNMTPTLLAELARTVRSRLAEPHVAGVVVTHGTDTMEESAFALDLVLDSDKPVVFTGAMRNASQPFPDGPRNLLAATQVAVHPAARGLGVVVVMHDEVHAASSVTKMHTTALNAFASPHGGPLGIIDDAGLWLRQVPLRLPQIRLVDPAPNVYLLKFAAGMDDLLLHAVLNAGARGVVLEASGAGNVYQEWEASIAALVERGVPVVIVSRTGGGRVVPAYGGPGGGKTIEKLGVIFGGDLLGLQARLVLMFALGAGWTHNQMRAYFAQITHHKR